jgi:hypothetical protein
MPHKKMWTDKETVIANAKCYGTKQEWKKAINGAVIAARRHGWYHEATAHMTTRTV